MDPPERALDSALAPPATVHGLSFWHRDPAGETPSCDPRDPEGPCTGLQAHHSQTPCQLTGQIGDIPVYKTGDPIRALYVAPAPPRCSP